MSATATSTDDVKSANNTSTPSKESTPNKKFSYQLLEKRDSWSVEIIRQVTSRKTVVSKRESGFESETQAKEWAEKELQQFINHQIERNKKKSALRREKRGK